MSINSQNMMFVILFTDIDAQSLCEARGLRIKYLCVKLSLTAYRVTLSCLVILIRSLLVAIRPAGVHDKYLHSSTTDV